MGRALRVPLAYSSSGGLFGFKNLGDFERIVDPAVRGTVVEVFRQRCAGETKFLDAFKELVWMNEEKGISVKKVRCFVRSVKNPLPLKMHGMRSARVHKQHYYVQNDSVHAVALYANGNKLRHVGFSALDTVANGEDVPLGINHQGKDYELKYILHSDLLVVFCKEDIKELSTLSLEDVCQRLYKINDFTMAEARMVFRHHMEAREKGKVLEENKELRGTKYPSSVDFLSPNPLQRISYTNMNVAVEGVDFCLNVLGEIDFLEE